MGKPTYRPMERFARGAAPAANAGEIVKAIKRDFEKVERVNPNTRTVAITANYAVDQRDRTILVDTTAGDVTVTLFLANTLTAFPISVIKTSADANKVHVVPSGANTIAGATSLVWSGQGAGYAFRADGVSEWWLEGTSTGLQARSTVQIVTANLANNASEALSKTLPWTTSALLRIQVSAACWVRLYASQADQTADAARNLGTTATAGTGVLAEFNTAGAQTIDVSPIAILTNDETPVVKRIWYTIMNESGGAAAITVTLTILPLEP